MSRRSLRRASRGSVLVETMGAIVMVLVVGLTAGQAIIQVVAAQRVATMAVAVSHVDSIRTDRSRAIVDAARTAAPPWLTPRVTVRASPDSGGRGIRVTIVIAVVAPRIAPWWPDTTLRQRVTITGGLP